MKSVHITLSARDIRPAELAGCVVVVIDVLRATSVMVTALQNGARFIRPVSTVVDAMHLQGDNRLLGGERNSDRIEGFDLGNSPLEYTRERVQGKEIILTTTNGTQALAQCHQADRILIGSFLNSPAIIGEVVEGDGPVELVCAGTNGSFSLDDFLCAGLLASGLEQEGWDLDDLGRLAIRTWLDERTDIHQALSRCVHYNILKNKGFQADLQYCLQIGRINLVPESRGGIVRISFS